MMTNEERSNQGAQLVAHCRERVVAQHIADMTFFELLCQNSLVVLEANVPIVVSLIGPCVAPIDEMQMKPLLMVANLIIRSQAECFPRDGESTMLTNFPETLRAGAFEKPQTSARLFGMDPGPHNGVGPGGVGRALSVKASSIVLMLSLLLHRHAVPLNSLCLEEMS